MITAAGRGEHEIMADHIADKIEKTADQAENQTENKMKRMRDLVDLLNRARRAYEQEDTEIMSNYEYDQLYDELQALEKELNTTLAASPTVNVGYEVLSGQDKGRGTAEGVPGRSKSHDLVEAGRPDHCPHIQGRRT